MTLHPQLQANALFFRDFVNGRPDFYDDNGHGTHVCGIIGGTQIGMAPYCKLIVLKVLDENGGGDVVYSMKGFRWILENQEKYNIRIVNISMGMKPGVNLWGEERILRAVEMLWDMGIVVVAAAGNLGPSEGSITIPGLSKKIITVGTADVMNSGRGSLQKQILKPDLVAPGANIVSCNSKFQEGNLYAKKSGTSMATPVVSGAVALLLSKEPNLTNEEVKKRLKGSCDNLNMPVIRQGSGILNVQRLLK
jgi:serine protease AprX